MGTKLNTKDKPIRISYWQRRIIYICPKCGKPITFRKRSMGKSLCVGCGQRLDWSPAEKFQAEIITAQDAADAAIIAEEYYQACGLEEKDWFNLSEFRKSLVRKEGIDLYLFFRDPKEYGRFKRIHGGKK